MQVAPLHVAAAAGALAALKALLALGIDLDQEDGSGQTALQVCLAFSTWVFILFVLQFLNLSYHQGLLEWTERRHHQAPFVSSALICLPSSHCC